MVNLRCLFLDCFVKKVGWKYDVDHRWGDSLGMWYQCEPSEVPDETTDGERRLSQSEYLTLLMDADTTKRQIRKTRYCLTYKGQYFEIDVYPFWDDKAIAEIELSDEDAQIIFPDHIKVIKEVTEDESYKNASLVKGR